MANPLRIILCGKTSKIATAVSAGLRPECEVIHVILTPTAGLTELPSLLSGHALPTNTNPNLGTQNFSQPPNAVVLGAGYDDDAIRRLRAACEDVSPDKGVPWLRPDVSVPTPPLGPKYGAHMVGRVKACLRELGEEGRGVGDGVYFY